MKTYDVFFKGEYQGSYKTFSAMSAYRMAALDYGTSLEDVAKDFGMFYSFKIVNFI